MSQGKRRQKKFNDHPFAYHTEFDLTIDALTNLGMGVGRVPIPDPESDDPEATRDWVVFVGFVLPGEMVRVRIYRNSANFSEADLLAIVEPSPDRVEPKCPLFTDCGGCQYQHATYEAQIDWKRTQVADLLKKHAGIEHPVLPVVPSPVFYGYRSKITPHFQKPRDGVIENIGFLRHGRRQQVLDVPWCPIASDSINAVLPELRESIRRSARTFKKGATLLLRDSAESLGQVCMDMTEVCEEVLGEPFNLRFQFPAGEFFQNNPYILPAFVQHVADEATAGGATHLVDAYCGNGLFSLGCASRFESVSGIEISEPAIDWAKRNAKLNRIENAEFVQGSAEAIFENIQHDPAKTTVVIDPPRKGSSEVFLEQLIAFGPSRVVYVSCNPATQIRDLEMLRDHFEIEKIQPFDLFPQTRHLECVVTLRKR